MGFAKKMLLGSGVLVMLLGLAIMILMIVFSTSNMVDAADGGTLMMLTGIIVGGFFMIVGIFGVCSGIVKHPACCILIYQIFMLAFVSLFTILLIVIVVYGSSLKSDILNSCAGVYKNDFAEHLGKIYPTNTKLQSFCTAANPCEMKDDLVQEYKAKGITAVGGGTITKISEVPEYKTLFYDREIGTLAEQEMTFMGIIEQAEDCAGFDKIPTFYCFSEVGRGIPKERCCEKIAEYIDGKYGIILGISIAIIVFGVLIILFGFYVCCKRNDYDELGESLNP